MVPTVTIAVEHVAKTYLGTVLRDGERQISRHWTDDWREDYEKAFREARRKVGGAGVVCVCDSVRDFRDLQREMKRTKGGQSDGTKREFKPVKRGGKTKQADYESGTEAFEPGADTGEDCLAFDEISED